MSTSRKDIKLEQFDTSGIKFEGFDNSGIKFEGFAKHEPMKINSFVEEGEKGYQGQNQEGYEDECMVDNDKLKVRNVHNDLKELEKQFNLLCKTADDENNRGNGDKDDEKHTFTHSSNSAYMRYQTNECRKRFEALN